MVPNIELVRRSGGAAAAVILGYCAAHTTLFYFLGSLLAASLRVEVIEKLSAPLAPAQLMVALAVCALLLWCLQVKPLDDLPRFLRWMAAGAALLVLAVGAQSVEGREPSSPPPPDAETTAPSADSTPAQDALKKLELVQTKTGFYRSIDVNSQQVLFVPTVLLKFKNVADSELSERIEVKGTFVANGEEWSAENASLQGYGDAPLQPKLARQIRLQSSRGYTSELGVESNRNPDIECQLVIAGKLFKTITIERTVLYTNVIQSSDKPRP